MLGPALYTLGLRCCHVRYTLSTTWTPEKPGSPDIRESLTRLSCFPESPQMCKLEVQSPTFLQLLALTLHISRGDSDGRPCIPADTIPKPCSMPPPCTHLPKVHVDVFAGALVQLSTADLFGEVGDANGIAWV